MEDVSQSARMVVKDCTQMQLYSCATPNGLKVAAALEELVELRAHKEHLKYEAHTINLRNGETRKGPYMLIAPHGKIPALVDPTAGTEEAIKVFESGACLMYLSEKYGELIPHSNNVALRAECISWLFFGCTSVSGQCKAFGFFYKYALTKEQYSVQRYAKEVTRLLGVLDRQLGAQYGKHWVCGDLFTIADLAMWPWIHALHENYDDAANAVFNDFKAFPHVKEWYARCLARPASQVHRGLPR